MAKRTRNRQPKFSENDNLVAQVRKMLGMKQIELAKLFHLSDCGISQFESGKCKISGPVEVLCKLILDDPDIVKRIS